MGSVGDSQKDLISVTVSDSPSSGTINNNHNMEPVFKVKSGNERRLLGALVVALLGKKDVKCRQLIWLFPACAGLVIALVVVSSKDGAKTGMADTFSNDNTCMTEGCIGKPPWKSATSFSNCHIPTKSMLEKFTTHNSILLNAIVNVRIFIHKYLTFSLTQVLLTWFYKTWMVQLILVMISIR